MHVSDCLYSGHLPTVTGWHIDVGCPSVYVSLLLQHFTLDWTVSTPQQGLCAGEAHYRKQAHSLQASYSCHVRIQCSEQGVPCFLLRRAVCQVGWLPGHACTSSYAWSITPEWLPSHQLLEWDLKACNYIHQIWNAPPNNAKVTPVLRKDLNLFPLRCGKVQG